MKILVGLSGGVDSAVAAHLLIEQGHEIVAGFMLNYLDEDNPNCTTKLDLESFHAVRKHLGIDAYEIFDYREEYEQRILNYIYEGYQQGITPSPDVYCNSLVKFDLFRKEAVAMGFDAIATGHYARITQTPSALPHPACPGRDSLGSQREYPTKGVYNLLKGVDHSKDQSYFLSQLDQEQLQYSLFPLGGINKSDVRQIAHQIGLPNADRPDSQGLCFVGKIKMSDFLHERLGEIVGTIVDTQGTIVGAHTGAYSYTIGQRRNLYLPFQAYVSDVDTLNNIITVARIGEEDILNTSQIVIHQPHWISGYAPQPGAYQCKIRYRQQAQDCILTLSDEGTDFAGSSGTHKPIYSITFNPTKGVANGQIVVIYDGDEVIGSGVIQKT